MRRFVLLLAVIAAGCGANPNEGDPGFVDAGGGGDGGNRGDGAAAEACQKMDILFVIDNSGSMREEQDNLIANFPAFAQVIESYTTPDGTPLDFRIAVTTAGRDVSYTLTVPPPFPMDIPFTESGDNGEFRAGCGLSEQWIDNTTSDVAGTFSCIADVGTGGPGAEMPLLGLEWSLNQRLSDGTNAAFVREDALLAIVFITDQDDCSRNDDGFTIDGTAPSCFDPADNNILPISHYLSFLDGLKGSRGRWASALIAGLGPGSCSSSFGNAAEAERMIDFANQVGTNSAQSSLCDGDLAGSLMDALDTFDAACQGFPPID